MNRVTLSVGLLFLLLIVVYANFLSPGTDQVQRGDAAESWAPNYQAKNMNSILYKENGSINHQVFATTMEHYDILGFTTFEKPEYTIYTDETDSPWQIIADEGTLYGDERIELEQNVLIKSIDQQEFVQTIQTSYVEINLLSKTAQSDQPVVISGKDFVINSRGFKVNLLTQKLELSDHVETIYQQPNLNQ